ICRRSATSLADQEPSLQRAWAYGLGIRYNILFLIAPGVKSNTQPFSKAQDLKTLCPSASAAGDWARPARRNRHPNSASRCIQTERGKPKMLPLSAEGLPDSLPQHLDPKSEPRPEG